MWCSSCYNHVSLINNVYPSQPGETGAKANNLSFLVFYAESRPQKLTKIGAYLEKRTARDISYSRIENLKVTLTILTVLVGSKCKQNLDLFLVSVVNIIAKMLESPLNTEIIEQISSAIVSFSAHHNHVILDVDSAFVIPYLKIIKILCKNVQENNENQDIQNKKKISSLRALYAIVSNDTFLKSPKIDEFLEYIIPAILANIQEKKTMGIKLYRSLSNTDISDVDMDNLAIQSINEIMQRINPVTFDKVFNPIYKYLESSNHMLNKKYLLKLFNIFTKAMNPQYRYLLVLYSLKHLKDYSNDLAIQTNIIYILSNIIKNGGGSVVTHIEVLDVLSDCLFETLQNSSKYNQKDIENLENAYIDCINSFTSNVSYPEQMNDIMTFLVNHLKLDTSNNEVILKCRIFIIRSLRFILEQRASFIENNPTFNTPLPIELFIPTLVLLKDSSFNLRLQYYFFLLLLMDQISSSLNSIPEDNKTHITKYRFMQNIHTILYEYSQKKLNQPIDYIMIINVFIKNVQVFEYDGIVEVVPLMFELENISKVKFKNKDEIMLQYAINTMIIEFFDYLSEYLGNESLGNYISQIKQNKIENGEWCDVSFTTAVISQWLNKTFNDVEWKSNEFKETSVYLDHDHIISILCDHEQLKEQFEDLPELLNRKYSPKAFMSYIKDELNNSKRMSHHSINDPKLVRNSVPPQSLRREMTRASIHIEDLKEVLGSFEQLDTLQNNDDILDIDEDEDNFKLTDEVNGLLDEITCQSRIMTNDNKNSNTTLINQPILSSYENVFNVPKKQTITSQEEYPLTNMDKHILYVQDSFINSDYSLHYK